MIKEISDGKYVYTFKTHFSKLNPLLVKSISNSNDNKYIHKHNHEYENDKYSKKSLERSGSYDNPIIDVAFRYDLLDLNPADIISFEEESLFLITHHSDYNTLYKTLGDDAEVTVNVYFGYNTLEIANKYLNINSKYPYLSTDFYDVFGFLYDKFDTIHIARLIQYYLFNKNIISEKYNIISLNSINSFISNKQLNKTNSIVSKYRSQYISLNDFFYYVEREEDFTSILNEVLDYFKEVKDLGKMDTTHDIYVSIEILGLLGEINSYGNNIHIKDVFKTICNDRYNILEKFIELYSVPWRKESRREMLKWIALDDGDRIFRDYISGFKEGLVLKYEDVIAKLYDEYKKAYKESNFIEYKVLNSMENAVADNLLKKDGKSIYIVL